MPVEKHNWEDVDRERLLDWGNFPATIIKPGGGLPEHLMLLRWAETPTGSLTLVRQVKVDVGEGLFLPVQFRTVAAGAWESIEIDGYSFDPEVLEEQLDSMRQGAAAEKLGLAGVPPGPNRAARRHPG